MQIINWVSLIECLKHYERIFAILFCQYAKYADRLRRNVCNAKALKINTRRRRRLTPWVVANILICLFSPILAFDGWMDSRQTQWHTLQLGAKYVNQSAAWENSREKKWEMQKFTWNNFRMFGRNNSCRHLVLLFLIWRIVPKIIILPI